MRCTTGNGACISVNHFSGIEMTSTASLITHYPTSTSSATDIDGHEYEEWEERNHSLGTMARDSITGRPVYLRFPIRDYILDCALPIYLYKGQKPLLELKDQDNSMRWPHIGSLECFRPPRALKSIERYTDYVHMALNNDDYFEMHQAKYIRTQKPLADEFRRRFLLPCKNIADFEATERAKVSDIQNDSELCEMFQTFVLGTASEAVKLMRCLEPAQYPAHQNMALRSQFQIRNNLFFDPYSMWKIFSLRDPADPEAAPLVLVFIEPSRFGIEDFDRFVRVRKLKHNEMDRPTAPADVIWAVIYEALKKGKGRKFVLTNYVRWAFGIFERGYETAHVTMTYEAKLRDLDGTEYPPTDHDQQNSVIEMLIRWMENTPEKKDLDRYIQRKYPD